MRSNVLVLVGWLVLVESCYYQSSFTPTAAPPIVHAKTMAAFGGSISRLLDMFVETGPGHHFTLAAFKSVYLVIYPEDSRHLFPKGEVKGAFREAVAAHLGVAVADIACNRRVRRASDDYYMEPASYAVCGFKLRLAVQELAEAEATMVKPDRIIQDLLDADPTKPLPSCLRWLVSRRRRGVR